MRIDINDFIDERTYAQENGDEFNYGIFPCITDNEMEEALQFESYYMLKTIGWNENLFERKSKAEKILKEHKDAICGVISDDSYNYIMELFGHFNDMLNKEADELWESYDSVCKEIEIIENNKKKKP